MTGTPLYEDHNEFLHGQKSRSNKDKIISSKFIRKYLYVAKMQKPILTKVRFLTFRYKNFLDFSSYFDF